MSQFYLCMYLGSHASFRKIARTFGKSTTSRSCLLTARLFSPATTLLPKRSSPLAALSPSRSPFVLFFRWSAIKCEGVGLRDRAVARKLELASASSRPAYDPAPFIPIGPRSHSSPISEVSAKVAPTQKKAGSTGTLQGLFAKQSSVAAAEPKGKLSNLGIISIAFAIAHAPFGLIC